MGSKNLAWSATAIRVHRLDLRWNDDDFRAEFVSKKIGPENPLNLSEVDFNGWVSGKFYRKTPYFMRKSMVSCRFSLKPIH